MTKTGPVVAFEKHTQDALHLGVLTFRDEATANALSASLVGTLEDEVRKMTQLATKNELHILVLHGGPEVFCSGSHLKERQKMTTHEVMDFVDRINELFDRIERIPAVTVSAIAGGAIAGGLELALACDMRMAAETAVMGLSETSLGIIPGAGGTYRLLRIMPEASVKTCIYTAQRFSAKEALDLGLVNKVYSESGFLDAVCRDLFSTFAHVSPFALVQTKRALDAYRSQREENFRQIERSFYLNTLYSEDRVEGLSAFAQKRPPRFSGATHWMPQT